jgi:capsule polysaccharide modification protein KpsS
MSEFYANQCATIENILKCLSQNQVLVVKEHPVDKGALLLKKFLDLRKKYSGLYFIPAEVHGRVVLERTSRVVTLTSTVGWEAFIVGKKVYVLGEIFYDKIVGLDSVNDFKKLKSLLRKPIETTTVIKDDIIHFIAQMVEISYRGNPFPYIDLYSKDNINNITEAIYSEVC